MKDRILTRFLQGKVTEREAIEIWNRHKDGESHIDSIDIEVEGGVISIMP